MRLTLAQTVAEQIDKFNHSLCRLVSWFTLFMALVTFAVVVLRYGFNLGWIAMQESVMYLHAALFLIGAAHTLSADEHVRVDVFYRQYSEKRKALTNLLGTLLLLLPVNVFILVMSWDYVATSWSLLEASPESGGLPLVFILKSLIPTFAVLMILQGFTQATKALITLFVESEQAVN